MLRLLLKSLICFTILIKLFVAENPNPSHYFENSVVLKEPNIYVLYWNHTKTDFIAEIHVKTEGWFAFGFSTNGGMDGSDVIVAWINENGKTSFSDRHIIGRNVIIDEKQDWFLLSSKRIDGYICVTFTRKIDTCDNEDLVIETGTPRVIYSWNPRLPRSDISYHGPNNRGTLSLPLLNSLRNNIEFSPQDNIKKYTFSVNATIPNGIDTIYYCHMFKLPNELLKKKHHLLRVETLIAPGNMKYLHHWVVHKCDLSYEIEFLKKNKSPEPAMCNNLDELNNTNPWSEIDKYCHNIIISWAVGGRLTIDFPQDLAYPIDSGEFTYFYLQLHYNNPELIQDIHDSSGVVLYVTDKLRKTEIGTLSLGARAKWSSILIPQKLNSFKLSYSCRKNCLQQLYNHTNITIFASAPHAHLTGVQIMTTQIRNGKEIAYIDKTLNYDFNYQYLQYLQTPVILQEGDELQLTCVYKTLNRIDYTKGGLGTHNEMVTYFNIIYYYPKQNGLANCYSTVSTDDWFRFLSDLNKTQSIEFNSIKTAEKDLETLIINEDVTNKLTEFFKIANHTQSCMSSNGNKLTTQSQLKPEPMLKEKGLC